MVDYLDPNKIEDSAAASLRKDLGQQAQLEGQLVELQHELGRLPENAPPAERARILLEMARAHSTLERGEEAWPLARTAFDLFAAAPAAPDNEPHPLLQELARLDVNDMSPRQALEYLYALKEKL